MSLHDDILVHLLRLGPLTLGEILEDTIDEDEDDVDFELKNLVVEELVETSGGGLFTKMSYDLTDEGIEEATRILGSDVTDVKPRVFLIHGHDYRVLRDVENLLNAELGNEVEVVVLVDAPNHGSESVHEKFVRYAPNEGDFAIAILTADDTASANRQPERQYARARQNAIYELGYCTSQIGQHRTWILMDPEVEQPSNITGGVFISIRSQWKYELLRDLRSALDDE